MFYFNEARYAVARPLRTRWLSGRTQAFDTIAFSAFVGKGLVGPSVVAGVSRSLPHGLGGFVDRRLFRHGERQSSIKLADDLE